jgi:hypothetical protein
VEGRCCRSISSMDEPQVSWIKPILGDPLSSA